MEYFHLGIDRQLRNVGQVNRSRRDVSDVDVFMNRLHDVVDFAADALAQLKQLLAIAIQMLGIH